MPDAFLLSLPSVAPALVSDVARPLLERAQRESGMIPNTYARMAIAPALLATYQDGYARFRAESGFTALEQEVVLLAISREHECADCSAAYSFLADVKSRMPRAVTDVNPDDSPIPGDELAVLVRFVRHLVVTRGRPTRDEAYTVLRAGYSEMQVLYLILAIAVKTMSDYSDNLFDIRVGDVFSARG